METWYFKISWGIFIQNSKYDWQYLIGDIDQRKTMIDNSQSDMRYSQQMDFGIEEYMAICKEFDIEPNIAINVDRIEYVKEAAELVEYLNGDITTKYGKERAKNGYPEPYLL